MVKNKLQISKKHKIIISIVALVVLLVAVTGYCLQSDWSRSTRQLDDNRQALHQSVEQVLLDDNSLSIDGLRSVRSTFARVAQQDCNINWWQQWRLKLSSTAKEYKAECKSLQVDSDSAAKSLDELINYLDFDQQAAQAINTANDAVAKLKYTDYDKAIKAWSAASGELREINPISPDAKTQSDQLRASISAIESAYNQLKSADKKQNRADYDKAVTKLNKAYKELSLQRSSVEKAYQNLAIEASESLARF